MLASALPISGACSLMAPSDADLLGSAAQSSSSSAGSPGSVPSQGGSPGAGTSSVSGEGGETALPPLEGEVAAPGMAGAGGTNELSAPIPREGLALWLMADHGVGEVDGGGVAVWADFSTNEADAKQSIGGLQPRLVPGANGALPLLEFDGEDDQLALPEGFADFSAGLSLFIVASQSTEQHCPSLLHLSNEPETQDVEVGRFQGAVHYEVADDEVSGPDNTFALQQLVLVGVVHAPSKAPELRLNGVFMATGDFTSLPEVKPRANNFIGRSLHDGCEPFHGRVGEIILYSRALDSTERGAVQRYLQGRWSYEPPVKTKPGPGEFPAAK